MAKEVRYVMNANYFDPVADLIRKYQVIFYPEDEAVEMYDLKNKRIFLKRTKIEGVKASDIFLGSKVNIFSRQLELVEFGDEFTKNLLERAREKTIALITGEQYDQFGKIIAAISADQFVISQLKLVRLTDAQIHELSALIGSGGPNLAALARSDYALVLELVGADAGRRWSALASSLRTSQIVFSGPLVPRAAEFFFGVGADPTKKTKATVQSSPQLNNCSLLIVKPHAFASGNLGEVFDRVLSEGFEISAAELFNISRENAVDFLEVYQTVIPEVNKIAEELCSGPLVALEVRAENVVQGLRKVAGPSDPEVAKLLRPESIRARIGVDKVRNGVHVTDLPEDGTLEVEFFFRLLQ